MSAFTMAEFLETPVMQPFFLLQEANEVFKTRDS